MKSYYLTDTGKVRSHNEDSVTIIKNASEEVLMVVSDGMGGHKAGEVASSLAVTHLGKRFSKLSSIGSIKDAVSWINDNVSEINEAILLYARENVESKGLGATLVLAIYTRDYLLFANIGDSSGFVYKNGKLFKVTKDHTLVNLLVEAGNITEEEAKNHPKKNVLMKALGSNETLEADIFETSPDVDGVLLCSDGLTNMLTKEQIEHTLNSSDTIENKVKMLIRKCKSRGGTENISVALMDLRSGCEK